MEYSYKFRIYPNAAQENLIQRTFGCSRFVFNHFLAERMEQYEKTGKAPTRFQQDKELTALKKELLWLKEVDATELQASLQLLYTAYQNLAIHVLKASIIIDAATKANAWVQTSKCWKKRCSFPNWGL